MPLAAKNLPAPLRSLTQKNIPKSPPSANRRRGDARVRTEDEEDWESGEDEAFHDSEASSTLPLGLSLPVAAWIRAKDLMPGDPGENRRARKLAAREMLDRCSALCMRHHRQSLAVGVIERIPPPPHRGYRFKRWHSPMPRATSDSAS